MKKMFRCFIMPFSTVRFGLTGQAMDHIESHGFFLGTLWHYCHKTHRVWVEPSKQSAKRLQNLTNWDTIEVKNFVGKLCDYTPMPHERDIREQWTKKVRCLVLDAKLVRLHSDKPFQEEMQRLKVRQQYWLDEEDAYKEKERREFLLNHVKERKHNQKKKKKDRSRWIYNPIKN